MDPIRLGSSPSLVARQPQKAVLHEQMPLPLDIVVPGPSAPGAPLPAPQQTPEPGPAAVLPPSHQEPDSGFSLGANGSLLMEEPQAPPRSAAESMLPPPIEPPPTRGAPPHYRWGGLGGMLHGMAGLVGAVGAQEWLRLKDAPTSPVLDQAVFSLTSTRATNDWLKPTYQALETALADPEATMAQKRFFGGGVNGTYLVTLSNGARGIFKPTAAENQSKLRANLEEDHQGKREQAAYIVDKHLGHMGRVPPTVRRSFDGQEGAFIYFVPGTTIAASATEHWERIFSNTEEPNYHRLSVFDNVIGNLDRHTGNWMINERGEAVPIDHGLCFPHRNGDQGYINYDFGAPTALHEEDKDMLTRFMMRRAEISEELSPLLEKVAIDAMFERVEGMLARGRTYQSWRGQPKEA